MSMNTKQKIIEATFECLAKKGSSNVSLRDISKEAGVALSQIHYYFSGREGLLYEAAAEFMDREQIKLKEYLKKIQDPLQRIEASLDFMREQQINHSTIIKIYFEFLTLSIGNPAFTEKTKALQEKWIESILQEDMNFGIHDRSLARLIIAFLDGLAIQTLQVAKPEELDRTYKMFCVLIKDLLKREG